MILSLSANLLPQPQENSEGEESIRWFLVRRVAVCATLVSQTPQTDREY
jgi:hypothetical protein